MKKERFKKEYVDHFNKKLNNLKKRKNLSIINMINIKIIYMSILILT